MHPSYRPSFMRHGFEPMNNSMLKYTNMNDVTKNIWLAVFGSFFMWWIFQLWLHVTKLKTHTQYQSIPAGTFEGPRVVTWSDKLKSASDVARDCFIMLFSVALAASAVGATRLMGVFTWIFFGLSLIWEFVTLGTISPAVHVLFTLATTPFLIAIVIMALSMYQ